MRKLSKLLSLGIFLGFAAVSYGQLGRGAITGTVTDPSGAVVPGATVTLVNQGTAVQRTDTTNPQGVYRFEFADVGTYTLKVSAPGFANYEATGIVLTVAQTVTSDVRLEVAKTAQTITVEAGGIQLVNTANAEISGLVSRSTIANLPLEIRDAGVFVNLQPGAVPDAFNGSTRGAAVNGQRGGTGNFMIDGTDNNDYGQGGRSHNSSGTIPGGMVSVSPDAVQEFRVVTNNFSAEYGRSSGFVSDTVLRSGSNQVHGSAFEYNRNSATTANDFFTNKVGGSDQLIRNQFGGSIGGPIKKDKAFVFGALEFQRLRQTTPQTVTTVAQPFVDFVSSGGFANFVNQNLSSFGLAAPIDCSNPKNPGCTLGPNFQQLDGQSPLPRATSISQTSTSCPSCVSSSPLFGGVVYPVPEEGQATYASKTIVNETRWSVRYDQHLTDRDSLNVHWLYDNFPTTNSGIGGDFFNPAFPSIAQSRSQNGAIGWTRTLSPDILNELKFSYLRSHADFPCTACQVPSIGPIDASSVGFGSASALPQGFTENTFQYQDNLSIIHGRNSFKVGGEYRRTRNGSFFDADFNGLYLPWDMENMLTDGAIGELAGAGGFYYGEAAINPSSPTPALPQAYRGYRANELGMYIEDDIKATSHVTLNLGLRYDYFGVPHNYIPNIDSNYYFGSQVTSQCIIQNATAAQVCLPGPGVTNPVSTNPFYPVNPATAAEFSGNFQVRNNEIWNKDTNNFAPRFGVAWDVGGKAKTIIRFGGGIFYDRMWNNLFENIRFNPPYYAFSQVGLLFNGATPGPISDPGFYTIPINLANFAGAGATPSPRHIDQNLVTAYSEDINFDIQRELGGNWLLDVAYVGTFGHKLTGVVDLNTFNGRSGFGFSSRRINPNIGADNARGNFYNSNYSGLQARITKRLSHGVQFDINYTWSHALDYVSDAFNNKAGGDYHPEDQYNRSLEYGNADFDIRHRFVGDFVWNMPFFQGRKLLGGWSLNGVVTLQTGSPFTIFDSSTDTNGDGHFNDRGMFLGSGNISSGINHSVSPASGYLNAGMFGTTVGPAGVPVDGLLARNAVFGPGFDDIDMSIQKSFQVTERLSFKFVVSAFNLFNRPNFIMVPFQGTQQGGDISNPQFGQAPQTVQPNNSGTGARNLQFGLRLDF
jgi:Carboxypeptidase regulatory-like domain/TonB dependent receptor-like, beta-barrel